MAIEIYFDNPEKGADIRGTAMYIDDVFHEQLIEICSLSQEKYPRLEELSFIEDDQKILITPLDMDSYVHELESLMSDNKLFQPLKPEIIKFISILKTSRKTQKNLNVFLDY